jgi:2-methylcitrate dehydratase PrpD
MTHQPTASLVQEIARFVVAARGAIPNGVASDARLRVLDLLGNSLAARREGVVLAVDQIATRLGGPPEATSLAALNQLPIPTTALVNGTMAHALDFDDTHLRSVLHPSASVIPAAMAMAEAREAPGDRFLAAVAAGLEVCVRLGDAGVDPVARDSIYFERGFHATSICGALGAAASAASLLGLPAEGIAAAIAIAASMGAGLLEANRTGGTVKPIHCGWAGHAGTMAALFAEAGVTGPPTVLEGRFGFLEAHLGDRADTRALRDGLGDEWRILSAAFKPYPTNHFTHAGIDAAIALRRRGLVVEEIESVELGVPAPTLRTIAEPEDEKASPMSGYAARFSGPFTVATALTNKSGLGVALDDMSDASVRDPLRLGLARLVRCVPDEEATQGFPERFGAVLRVRLKSGDRLEERIFSSRGGPGNPLSNNDLETKFRLNLVAAEVGAAADEVTDCVAGLSEGRTVQDLMAAVRRRSPKGADLASKEPSRRLAQPGSRSATNIGDTGNA